MQNKSINNITKLIVLFIISFIIILSKSIEANIILFILTLILILKNNISGYKILNILYKNIILLIITGILSLIFTNIFLLIKMIIFILLINVYIITTEKIYLYNDLNIVLKPFKIFNVNTNYYALKIVNYFSLFNKEKRKNSKSLLSQNRIFLNINIVSITKRIKKKLNNLCLRLSKYEINNYKFCCNDFICLIITMVYLGLTIYKEVIM